MSGVIKKKPDGNRENKLESVNTNSNVSNELEKLIHERTRLGIISALAANESLSFNELKNLLETSDGNISVHARKLEEAGYISQEKSFENRKPLTVYAITEDGKTALKRYIDHMGALIRAVKDGGV